MLVTRTGEKDGGVVDLGVPKGGAGVQGLVGVSEVEHQTVLFGPCAKVSLDVLWSQIFVVILL